ncbi:MAG: PHP domain-containing protein, partial [Planctomycetota bacterium]|nr:PHP domain-containing protein [Planctomycetota bacterium]
AARVQEAAEPKIAGRDEAEIYRLLGLDYIPPELREDRGEIEAAQCSTGVSPVPEKRRAGVPPGRQENRAGGGAATNRGGLPRLISRADIRGDLHVHSDWTDGRDSIETIARAALALGYKYIAITDHTQAMAMVGGLTDARILQQRDKIRRLNDKLKGIRVLAGTECDIRADGSLDIADKTLAQLDVVVASIHSRFHDSRDVMTRRIIRALESEHVDILAHPTGRLIGEREAYDVDIDAVFEAAKRNGKALELNSFPDRLDLNDVLCRKAKEMRIPIAISTDSHSAAQLAHIEYGVATARRGWLEPADVVNTRDKSPW